MLVKGDTTIICTVVWVISLLETYCKGTVHKKGHNILVGYPVYVTEWVICHLFLVACMKCLIVCKHSVQHVSSISF